MAVDVFYHRKSKINNSQISPVYLLKLLYICDVFPLTEFFVYYHIPSIQHSAALKKKKQNQEAFVYFILGTAIMRIR